MIRPTAYMDLDDGKFPSYTENMRTYPPILNSICPGINVAVAELYLAIVQVLAVYTISKAVDKHGREIDVKVEYSSGTIRYVYPPAYSV
jgi:hypothetical protein